MLKHLAQEGTAFILPSHRITPLNRRSLTYVSHSFDNTPPQLHLLPTKHLTNNLTFTRNKMADVEMKEASSSKGKAVSKDTGDKKKFEVKKVLNNRDTAERSLY